MSQPQLRLHPKPLEQTHTKLPHRVIAIIPSQPGDHRFSRWTKPPRAFEKLAKKNDLTMRDFIVFAGSHQHIQYERREQVTEALKNPEVRGALSKNLWSLVPTPEDAGFWHNLFEVGRIETVYTARYTFSGEELIPFFDYLDRYPKMRGNKRVLSRLIGEHTCIQEGIRPLKRWNFLDFEELSYMQLVDGRYVDPSSIQAA